MTGNSTRYSGDITLTGAEAPPVELRGPDDAFVTTASVSGDLAIHDPEYVFTHHTIDDGTGEPGTDAAPDTVIQGDIEDGYVKDVAGDLCVTGVEDVFIARDSVNGDLAVPGAENVYTDEPVPDIDPEEYDVSTIGWQQTAETSDPSVGVSAVGMDHTIEVTGTRSNIDLYLVGHGHTVTVEGRSATVSVHFVGYGHEVRIGPYLTADVVSEAGYENTINAAPYPVQDLIEMPRRDAYRNAGWGKRKVTFQVPAVDDDEWCPNCGREADAIIERHQMEAFFLFGRPVRTYDRSTNPARECEHCSPNAVSATLSPEERRAVLQ